MSEFHIAPAQQPLKGRIRVPADKSISHRAAILSTLAEGETRIENYLRSETTHATLNCLRALGAEIEQVTPETLVVHGRRLHSLREPADVLFCLGSGTTMRLLAGLCAGQDFLSVLDGTPALKRRPMARVVEPLRAMGATILARDNGRLPPLAIRGGGLHGIDYTLPVASAQVKSAILLAGLFADGPTTICEPGPSRDHTERMLRAFGVNVESVFTPPGLGIRVYPASDLRTLTSITIPGDISSAAFFIVAALIVPRSEICVESIGVNPTRTGLLDALAHMGARVTIQNEREESGEPVADVNVYAGDGLRTTEVACDLVPRMIDEFPIFAVAATQAHGETAVRDASELRVKESDRIGALAQELCKMGARIEERADGFVVQGPTQLRGARVSAHNDHRLAMSLAVAGLIAQGETVIEGWECVADSFPNFGEVVSQIAKHMLNTGVPTLVGRMGQAKACIPDFCRFSRGRWMKRLFLLGSNIAYSLSPAMHNAALLAAGLDWHYELWDLPVEALPEAIAHLRLDDSVGANVTIPHKEAVIEWLDELGESARDVRAVNTIVKRDGRLIGENTDILGFLRALQDAAFEPRGAHAIILGAGSAARGVAFALAQAGVTSLTILNRTLEHAETLADQVRRHFRLTVFADLANEPASADLVVNSLPPSASFDLGALRLSRQALAFDLTYRPAETPFLRAARLADIRAVNGLGMLVYQGAASLEMWTGQNVPVTAMFKAARRAIAVWDVTREV